MKTYLGDSVYAEWDGNDLHLTTENCNPCNDPSNLIVLEPQTLAALFAFVGRLKQGEQRT